VDAFAAVAAADETSDDAANGGSGCRGRLSAGTRRSRGLEERKKKKKKKESRESSGKRKRKKR
jgi:hypothetical protein